MKLKRPATVLELLVAARELIGVRERWCFGALALTKLGRITAPRGPSAVSWCAVGALRKCASQRDDGNYATAITMLESAARELGANNVVSLNDKAYYPQVLRMFDVAIAEALVIEAQS